LKNHLRFGAQEHSLAYSSHMQKDEILNRPNDAFDQHTNHKNKNLSLCYLNSACQKL